MYLVKLEKDGVVRLYEFTDKVKALDFTVLGVACGWKWDVFKLKRIRQN